MPTQDDGPQLAGKATKMGSMDQIDTEKSERANYLRKLIFKSRCPVCLRELNAWHVISNVQHAVAHVGSCNFNGPNLSNGFLRQVKNREWSEVIEPFTRMTSMDMMSCELLRCPDSLAIAVWVEVDLAIGGDEYLAYLERIDEYDLSRIERVTALCWTRFLP
jgi:hypothetical protein